MTYKVIINFIFKNKKKKVYLNQNLVISLLIRTHQKMFHLQKTKYKINCIISVFYKFNNFPNILINLAA